MKSLEKLQFLMDLRNYINNSINNSFMPKALVSKLQSMLAPLDVKIASVVTEPGFLDSIDLNESDERVVMPTVPFTPQPVIPKAKRVVKRQQPVVYDDPDENQ